MRITCPNCAAVYDVPAERLAGGRTVRCARCGSGWVPPVDESAPEPPPAPVAPEVAEPNVPEAAMPGVAEPEPASAPAPAATAGGRLRRLLAVRLPVPVLLAWVGSLVLLGVLVWAVIAWRLDVMRVWPPSERLYSALGLLRR